MTAGQIVTREAPADAIHRLTQAGYPLPLARLFAARGIAQAAQLDTAFAGLHPCASLRNCEQAAGLLADAIEQQRKLMIVADYDSDGATACALAVSVMRAMGARIGYLVPNRFEYGYGLTPEIAEVAARQQPDWLITVDNGIASFEGVATARRLGMQVLITDHHLPADRLPEATCVVNPNQAECGFPSKHLAGVGVMFYVLLALRAELRRRHAFVRVAEPNLADALDLVALGTVADVARLDDNNRILVANGLRRIRAGRARPGIEALFRLSGRDPSRATAYDLAFVLGPRLNAAGRLTDMTLGIECLLTQDAAKASELAAHLDALNRERRDIEARMHDSALDIVETMPMPERYSLCLYDANWHQGVIGILAARLKERFHRPVFAFAPGSGEEAKGSGRSIAALHLRDALDLVAKRHPGLILRFGGHAAAAGLTLRKDEIARFADAFEEVVRGLLGPSDLDQVTETDGALAPEELCADVAEAIDRQVWGPGFAPPIFCQPFQVLEQSVVGGKHLRLRLCPQGEKGPVLDAIRFGEEGPLPARLRALYRLQLNHFNGSRRPQLVIERWMPE